jgi:excisionase family DNA binding protein
MLENPFSLIFQKLENLQQSINDLNNQSKEPPPEDDITNVKGAAKILDSTSGTIYNLVHERRIPYHKQGKKLYFFKSELLEWIKRGKHKTREQIAEDVNQKLSEKKKGRRINEPLNTPSKEQNKNTDFLHSEKIKAALATADSQGETIEEATKETGELHYLQHEANLNIGEEVAKNLANPKMLFDEFWRIGELCILFADTGVGKSILATQIGNSIALVQPIKGFKMEAEKQKILYLDFELSDKQFKARYSKNYKNHYQFCDNFLRVPTDSNSDYVEGKLEEFFHTSVDSIISEQGTKILIVDNITCLFAENKKAKDALQLMKGLMKLKTKHNLSILVLAQTPKRDHHKPITKNDLHYSKMLLNFCDSSFAIGECKTEKESKYLKQIKARNTELIFDANNVAVCKIVKLDNYLMFQFQYFNKENELLMKHEGE